MAKWLEWLEKKIGGGPDGSKRVQTFRWLILVGLAGAAVMIIQSFMMADPLEPEGKEASPLSESQTVFKNDPNELAQFQSYEQSYENELKDIIQNIVGVSGVDVLVTIDATEEIVVYQDVDRMSKTKEEKDRESATRHITEMSEQGKIVLHEVSGQQKPIIIKKIKPKIRGVIIVAAGAENVQVKQLILETVTKGLDVPAHRVSIVPRKRN